MQTTTLALTLLALAMSGCRAHTSRFNLPHIRPEQDSLGSVEEFQQLQAEFKALKVYEQYEPRVAAAPQ